MKFSLPDLIKILMLRLAAKTLVVAGLKKGGMNDVQESTGHGRVHRRRIGLPVAGVGRERHLRRAGARRPRAAQRGRLPELVGLAPV